MQNRWHFSCFTYRSLCYWFRRFEVVAPHGHRIYSSFHPCPDLRVQHTSNKLVLLRCQRIFPMRIRSQPFQTVSLFIQLFTQKVAEQVKNDNTELATTSEGSIVDRLTKWLWQPVSHQRQDWYRFLHCILGPSENKEDQLNLFFSFLESSSLSCPPQAPQVERSLVVPVGDEVILTCYTEISRSEAQNELQVWWTKDGNTIISGQIKVLYTTAFCRCTHIFSILYLLSYKKRLLVW